MSEPTTTLPTDEADRQLSHQIEIAQDEDDLPSTGLLSFYDRLRERLEDYAAERGGKLGATVADVLLLVPDVFMLLVRLALDPDVPKSTRALIGGALAYFVLPFDLLPEALLGPGAFTDDLVLSLTVLNTAFSKELQPLANHYWSGSKPLQRVITDVLSTADALLGENLYKRLNKLLKARGIKVKNIG